jgi:AcrR family transcriptional regulator
VGVRERREREYRQRDEDILAAALRLFRDGDWGTVTIDQIAQGAEIGKGTVYKHVSSKLELYARLALGFQQRVLARLRSLDPAEDPLVRLRAMVRGVAEEHRGGEGLRDVVQYCQRSDFRRRLGHELRGQFEGLEMQARQLFAELVRAGIERRQFPRRPVAFLLGGLEAALDGMAKAIWGGHVPVEEFDAYVDGIADFVSAGLMYQGRVGEGSQ